MTPIDDRTLLTKVPVPKELVSWAKECTDLAETEALLAEAQASDQNNSLEELLPRLESLVAEPV